jgi:hypothetical protein
MKRPILIFSFLLLTFAKTQSENFIVHAQEKDSKLSKNDLKENIGREMKDALNNCAELNKQLGQIQIQLSQVQKQLFEKVEQLIDNKQPFKKASRTNLNQTYRILQDVKSELTNQVNNVKKLSLQMNNDSCLKNS